MSDEKRFLIANVEALTQGEGDYVDHIIGYCNWQNNKQCDFMFQGQMWTNSNMIRK